MNQRKRRLYNHSPTYGFGDFVNREGWVYCFAMVYLGEKNISEIVPISALFGARIV